MSAPSLRQRVVRGVQAQVAALTARTIVQIGTVSVLAGTWGLDLYGEWLILAAVPTYLAVSDIGFFVAGSNAMIIKVAGDDRPGALAIFQAVSSLVAILFGIAVAVLVGVAIAAPLTDWFNFEILSEATAGSILVVLGLNVLVASYAQLLYGGFACEGRYGQGQFVNAGITMIEFASLATVVLLGGDPAAAAIAMFAARLPCTAAMYLLMRRRAPWLRLGRARGLREELRPLLSPALASGAFPAGLALNVQGLVILVGVVLGPASAAVFSTLRTMSRIIVQVLSRVFMVIAPELGRAYAEGDQDRLRAIHRSGSRAALWLTVPILAALALFGDPIVRLWTAGAVDPPSLLLQLFLAVAALDSVWFTSLAVMFARNGHQRLAAYYLVASAVALAVGYSLLELWDLDGVAVSLVLFEAFMLVVTLRQVLPAAHDTLRGWLAAAVKPPPIRALPALLSSRSEPSGAPTEV